MEKYTSKKIREIWLNFFKNKEHEIIKSKSLIPINDNSILWINSGVATLKEYFSGKKIPNNPRMVNSQKCIRTNDIENVGSTSRHHTFFEMLGNFSIGNYFKDKALEFAIEILFKDFNLKKEHTYITYFEEDQDTYKKWIKLGISPSNLIKGNKKTNFWDIGQGPCGPCTEIFYDRGEKYDPNKIGLKLLENDLENDRYIEIWNIVFSQFNNDGKNNYEELIQKNIDTGAGLERLTSILQDVPTNFDTDLFTPIIKEIEKLSNKKYDINNYFIKNKKQNEINKKIKIIADHIRAITFSIQDGAKPSNTKRGYIIRRLIRRAYRTGIQLGINGESFLFKLVPFVANSLDFYKINIEQIQKIIQKEEISFSKTIEQGEKILLEEINKNISSLDPEIAFKLFETFGFPIELTKEIISEKNISLNLLEFKKLMENHSIKSKGKNAIGMEEQIKEIQVVNSKTSNFIGYDFLESNSKIIKQVKVKDKFYILLDKTPFYATKGGQLNDWGLIQDKPVENVFRDKYENHWHVMNDYIEEENVKAIVNKKERIKKERNHSSTHLLGLALTKVFGKNTIQLGSYNDEKKLRLDFNLDNKPLQKDLEEVEKIVNDLIDKSIERKYKKMYYQEAIEKNVLALEGEVYKKGLLRIVEFRESKEFCGGTHIENTSLIEKFKIIKLDSKGSGIFRIEAITSYEEINKKIEIEKNEIIKEIEHKIQKNIKLDSKYSIEINGSLEELKLILKKVKKDNKKMNSKTKTKLILIKKDLIKFNGFNCYIDLDVDNPFLLKKMAMKLREEVECDLIIIASKKEEKQLIAITSKKINAKNIFDKISKSLNGKGGGNEIFAMGSIDKIDSLESIKWEK